MAKDYAKHPYKKNRTFLAKGWRERLLSVIWLLAFAAILGFGAYYFWKDPKGQVERFYTEFTTYLFKKNGPKPFEKKETLEPKKPEVQFHFYTELPKMQVPPALSDTNKAPIKEQYVVQIGPFHSAKEASEIRISLLLAGFEVDLIKKDGIFMLQEGPYQNINDAKKMQTKMKKKGYENVELAPL